MRAALKAGLGILMLIVIASPAAQIRLFKDGQIIKIGPTKAERRARQTGVMMGAMSGRQPAPDANTRPNKPAPAPLSNQGIIRDVERAR